MMDARSVWDMWRRILSSDLLAGQVLQAGRGGCGIALDPVERDIFDAYAKTPTATETNLAMFRRGLVRNAKGALRRIPFAGRLAEASGIDLGAATEQFVRDGGYIDYGPHMWTAAEAFLDWLAKLPEFASPLGRDVLAIEGATTALARRLGRARIEIWPDMLAKRCGAATPAVAETRFAAHPAATMVMTAHDLTPMLENPHGYDGSPPVGVETCFWAVYFADADADAGYAELSERSARIFSALSQPASFLDLCSALDGLVAVEVKAALDALCALGVVAAVHDAR
jgi:hypothetical protein